MTLYDKWFGKGRLASRARKAELRGDLTEAALLFGEAGEVEEAARIMMLRGDGETDARARLGYFTHAAKLAPEGTETNKAARRRRAGLLLALAGDPAVSAVARHDVLAAAQELEAIGAPLEAAEAFARAGDKEGQARTLQAAGDVERLEFLLASEQHRERVSRSREERIKDVDLLVDCGRRREALETLDAVLARTPDDPARDRANGLRSRRVIGPVIAIDARAEGREALERYLVALGEEVVIGRTEGSIKIASNAVSRKHLVITRDGDRVIVRDLGSRNGTQLRGIDLGGPLPVAGGIDLKLGKEVSLRVAPSRKIAGAIEIEIAGETYFASLTRAFSPVSGWELVAGDGGWVELVSRTARAFAGDVELAPVATLLVGDAISTTRGGQPVLRTVGR
jgi:hypothetical protein